MTRRSTKWCGMCGAAPGEDCKVVSGSGRIGDRPGDRRSTPHFYRAHNHRPAVLWPDEPAEYARLSEEPSDE